MSSLSLQVHAEAQPPIIIFRPMSRRLHSYLSSSDPSRSTPYKANGCLAYQQNIVNLRPARRRVLHGDILNEAKVSLSHENGHRVGGKLCLCSHSAGRNSAFGRGEGRI